MHKRFGFKEEGVFKKHVCRGDKYEDVIRIALFAHNWEAIRSNIVRTFRLDDNI
jgi:RimJ/RimL family protein N-acetyltransferase